MSSPRALIGRHLLDFRLVRGDHLMARHAEIDAGDSARPGPDPLQRGSRCTACRWRDALCACRRWAEPASTRAPKNSRTASPTLRCAVVKTGELCAADCDAVLESSSRHRAAQDRPRQDDHPENHCNTKPTVHTECGQRQITLLEIHLCLRTGHTTCAPHAPVNPEFANDFGFSILP